MTKAIALMVLALTASGVTADWWADFSNNLFTDLTPLITLFGEQPTKQFLSESLTYLDYFIFAMAPLGVLTAVISAIRIRGGTSLRAFIGRAQEGSGAIEAELCSSTSRDICELYVNGGIARVLGTPRLLELVHDPKANKEEFIDKFDMDCTAGLYTPRSYLGGKLRNSQGSGRGWKEIKHTPRARDDLEAMLNKLGEASQHIGDNLWAPAPNLTLALWMQQPHKILIWLAAISGIVLQTGVVVVAAVLTYRLQLKIDDKAPNAYGFPLMAAGTVLLCSGNFLCAFLVGETTRERIFERQPGRELEQPTRMVWLQPGGQVIGDQTFDAFAYNDVQNPNRQYVTSWKDASQPAGGIIVRLAIICSTTGFVAQFVGLRGLHPLVSVAQLGAILAMSVIRSLLRTQRLSRGFNLLDRFSSVLKSHELDWLAMHLELDDKRREGTSFIENLVSVDEPVDANQPIFWVGGRAVENKRSLLVSNRYPPGNQSVYVVGILASNAATQMDDFLSRRPLSVTPALRILAYRTRLARLTNHERPTNRSEKLPTGLHNWNSDHVSCRNQAQYLASVIMQTAELIWSDESPFWDSTWRGVDSFSWAITFHFSGGNGENGENGSNFFLNIQKQGPNGAWKIDVSILEAVLGLGVMSLTLDPKTKRYDYDQAIDSISVSTRGQVSNHVILSSYITDEGLVERRSGIGEELELLWFEGDDREHYHYHSIHPTSLDSLSTNQYWNPYSVWEAGSAPSLEFKLIRDFPPNVPNTSSLVRLFGWNAYSNVEESIQGSDSSPTEIILVTRPTSSSLTSLCAQEIYASFMRTALPLLDCHKGVFGITASGEKFRVEHSLLDKCFDVFAEKKLGSRKDAVQCVLSSISPDVRVSPNRAQFIRLVYFKAQQLRQTKDWTQSQRLFRWAFRAASIVGSRESDHFTERSINNIRLVLYQKAFHEHPTDSALFFAATEVSRDMDSLSGQMVDDFLIRKFDKTDSAQSALNFEQAMRSHRYKDAFFLLESRGSQLDWMDLSVLMDVIQYSATENQDLNEQSKEAMYAAVLTEALLDNGAFDPNAIDEISTSLLSKAAQRGAIWAVESLVRRGANPKVQDIEQMTALYWAAKNGSAKIVELLLSDETADIPTYDEDTFLDYVIKEQGGLKHDVLKAVLEFPERRERVLNWALRKLNVEDALEALTLLFSTSFTVYFSSEGWLEAAVLRIGRGRPHWSPGALEKILRMLVKNGLVIRRSIHHNTAFVSAAELEPVSTLAVLLKLKPDFIKVQGRTPQGVWGNALMAASSTHDLRKVKFLLDKGASCEPVDSQTSLHFAVRHALSRITENTSQVQVDELVKLLVVLIEAGVKKDVADDQGKTAWDYARQVRGGVEQWKIVLDVLDPNRGQKDS